MHAAIVKTASLHWPSEAACQALAERWAACWRAQNSAPPFDVLIELEGALGAGKTTFVRHLLAALGVEGRIKSPSFALLHTYTADAMHAHLPIAHFDFYRSSGDAVLDDLGLREALTAPGLRLVEWASQLGEARPQADVRMSIAAQACPDGGLSPAARSVQLCAFTPAGERLLA